MGKINDFGFPFTSVTGDRQYSASEWRDYFESLMTNGVVTYTTNELIVKQQAVANKTVYVDLGSMLINGTIRILDTTQNVTITDNTSGNARIDRIVARLNYTDRKIEFGVLTGTPAGSPVAPTLTRNTTVWELSLAQIAVANGFSTIVTANITDERSNDAVCGFMEYKDRILSDRMDKVAEQVGTISGKRTSRFVIGTSTAGWIASDCDYLCDGTADQVEINAAITALPANGGEIIILDGTYNITAKINVNKNNVSITGNGNSTILKRMYNSTLSEGIITLASVSYCRISDLNIDGNRVAYTSGNNLGVYLTSSNNNTITGNTCNSNNTGVYLNTSSSSNTITGNTCNGTWIGIEISLSNNNIITSNTCNGNSNTGIYLILSNNNTITVNNFSSGGKCVDLNSSNNNTITGNNCNSGNGIHLAASDSNIIAENTCIRGTGLVGDYTASQSTIRLYSTANDYNLISSNLCLGKAVLIEGGTSNTDVNNKFA